MASPLISQNENVMITYKKGSCFGQCPVYNITVSNDGKLTYIGKRFVEKEGTFERTLNKKELRKLKRKFKKAKIGKIPLEENKIADAATTTYKYKNEQIKLVFEAPKKLAKAEAYLHSLAPLNSEKEYDWVITEKKKVKPHTGPSTKPAQNRPGRIENANPEIIVQLNAGIDLQEWLNKYNQYGVEMKKKIVPNRELYLLGFQSRKITFSELLKKMNEDEDVDIAEENKKVEMRGGRRGRGF